MSLTKIAKFSGVAGIAVEGFVDARGLFIYYRRGYDAPGAVGPAEASADMLVAAGSAANPLFAVTVGAPYFVVETLYPNGWVGALDHSARITEMNQRIVPGFNLYRDFP